MDDVLTLIQFIEINFIEGRSRRDPFEEYSQIVQKHVESTITENKKDLNEPSIQTLNSNCDSDLCDTKVLSINQKSFPAEENGAKLILPDSMMSSSTSANEEGYLEEVKSDDGVTNHIRGETQDGIVLDRIFVYPVKSCAGFEVCTDIHRMFSWFVALLVCLKLPSRLENIPIKILGLWKVKIRIAM